MPEYGAGIWVLDSIVDSAAAAGQAIGSAAVRGPALTTERSTFFGELWLRQLQMSECIATGRIDVSRTQEGCVRFSYVVPGSRTPRRYRCQPDLAAAAAVAKAVERNPALTAAQRAQIARPWKRRWFRVSRRCDMAGRSTRSCGSARRWRFAPVQRMAPKWAHSAI